MRSSSRCSTPPTCLKPDQGTSLELDAAASATSDNEAAVCPRRTRLATACLPPSTGGLRAHAGTAIAGGAYCVCPQPGDVAAGPAAEAGGPRRPLGPPRGSASAALDAAPRGVAAHRTRAGRARRIAHPLRRAHLLPGRHGPLRRRGCRCPTLASVMPPGRLLKPLSACRRRCPRPIPAPITPFGGRIWTFVNNAG